MKQPFFKRIVFLSIICMLFSSFFYGKIDPEIFSRIKPRSIGPANMSGRVSDVDVVIANPNIIYVGTATGGVWKSENGGVKWEPIFDEQSTSSIGAVTICQQNPNIVWVGTGEGNPRNSSGVGRGIFKSIDAGKTWVHLGLDKTEKISRLVLDPNNQEVAYAAALGTTWGENPERGVFKTTDGGKTWEKILYVDPRTGAADIAIAPDNPNKLLAAMWEHRRWPWFFKSGGPGSGLYITGDAGKNWKKLTEKDGLPGGELGRIGIAFARSRPNIVYAEVEAKKNALLRSEDGGFTWKTVNSNPSNHQRPFYYCDIRVNPQNENMVYSLQSPLWVSEDGGKTFNRLTQWTQAHPDYHAMWIHPGGEYMVVGNDGGIVISRDRGKAWQFARNLPLGQYYHISFDMETPYNVYGGLQDNGSWRGPSRVLTERGIYSDKWQCVGYGDGFDTEPDPEHPGCGYAMSQGGELYYFDARTGKHKNIIPTESDIKHRYNWNTGFAQDPFEPGTIYYGSQFVHRSRDRGDSWEIISPDLTTNDPEKQKQAESGGLTIDVSSAENHTTILCIAPSPLKKGVIWVGTDDGNVQLTQDEGKTWTRVSQAIKGVPACTWVPHVEASKFNPAAAFVVFDDHRRANWTPYLFMTEDYGKTWKNLASKDIDGFIHVIEQDHKNENLLFLGTEFGLYFSLDKGKEWNKWTSGFPTVPVRDLAVHPRENDLVIGTHGRSIYILDDISFLREISSAMVTNEAYLFQAKDFFRYQVSRVPAYIVSGDSEFMGNNPLNAAVFTFYFNPKEETSNNTNNTNAAKTARTAEAPGKKESPKEVSPTQENTSKGKKKLIITISDSEGKVVKTLRTAPKKGINLAIWDLKESKINMIEKYREYSYLTSLYVDDVVVFPGTYTIKLQYGDLEMKRDFQVKPDPRFPYDMEALKKNHDMVHEIQGWFYVLAGSIKEIKNTQKRITTVKELAKEADIKNKDELLKKAEELEKNLKTLLEKIEPDMDRQGIFDDVNSIGFKFFDAFRLVANSIDPPNQSALVKFRKTKALVEEYLKEYNTLFETEAAEFKKCVSESGLALFKAFKPLKIE